ncbi:hypothetical protein F0562_017592 [Nyssa sinensis]|uniref:Aminotransferase-like plant mobile domain-containing protein n=1 Tax=Nyssa sinensis TaxID=561372 RepID=A0A5J4ZH00_9ASTE|nr:hypothetical protein F0562_017592 [Nyssa sinensis]
MLKRDTLSISPLFRACTSSFSAITSTALPVALLDSSSASLFPNNLDGIKDEIAALALALAFFAASTSLDAASASLDAASAFSLSSSFGINLDFPDLALSSADKGEFEYIRYHQTKCANYISKYRSKKSGKKANFATWLRYFFKDFEYYKKVKKGGDRRVTNGLNYNGPSNLVVYLTYWLGWQVTESPEVGGDAQAAENIAVARQRRLPPTGGAAKEVEGLNLPHLAVVTDVDELRELIQSSLLSKHISILDATFLSSQASLSPEKAITESPLSISSDDSPNITSVKGIVRGSYHISSAVPIEAMMIGDALDVAAIQLVSTVGASQGKVGEDIVLDDSFLSEQVILVNISIVPTHVDDAEKNVSRASPTASSVFEGVTDVNNSSPVPPLTGEDIVLDDSFLSEQVVLVNISIVPTHADDAEKNVSRASPTTSSIFEGVTDVNNSFPILPLTNLDSDEDASPTVAET